LGDGEQTERNENPIERFRHRAEEYKAMQGVKQALIIFGVLVMVAWLVLDRETVEWLEELPSRFWGTWEISEEHDGNWGIQSVDLSAKGIRLRILYWDTDEEVRTCPIRKISTITGKGAQYGEMVVFYGEADNETTATHRLQVYFGTGEEIVVYQIERTPWDNTDRWVDIGKFIRQR
jgi:hypothetical protein